MNGLERQSTTIERWRLVVIYALLLLVFGYYAFKLFDFQVVNGATYLAQADENRTTLISEPTQRGIIYDRNGFVLARNVASYNVVITPADLPADPTAGGDPEAINTELDPAVQAVYRKLSELTGVPVSNGEINDETVRLFFPCRTDLGIAQIVYIADTNAPYDPMRITCNIGQELAMKIRALASEMPGVGIEVQSVRDYPTGSLTATVVGFLGPVPAGQEDYFGSKGFVPGRDKVGYAGLEATMQDILGGENGQRLVEVDVSGKELRNLEEPKPAIQGNNIVLTIDTRLQAIATQALVGEIDFWNTYFNEKRSSNGVAIAMNPKTGEILALVSIPTFENNRMARLIPADYYQQLVTDPWKPLFNHAISAEVPPGSVFKMPTAVGALNEGVVTAEQELNDPGEIVVMQRNFLNAPTQPFTYVCWEKTGHGDMNWLEGVANSCDVYFYKIGGGYAPDNVRGLGQWRLVEYANALGYGQRTGIELPGEARGLIPDPDWKRINAGESWLPGDTYIASMGQGLILSTPLQVLVSAAILGNDGKYMQPTLIREVLNPVGEVVKPFEPKLKWDVTKDPVIKVYDENELFTGEYKTIQPWVVEKAKESMRLVVTDGTGKKVWTDSPIQNSAGKTGTAEYCDNIAREKGLCQRGSWPTHSWYFGYAPYDDPEIAVVAFVYNGGEGASVAAPVVRAIIEGYFNLKAIDTTDVQP
ncbi:MAG: penicillin-binding protein 2 [Anaerolineae bacterium]|nr:penicillin-binding protein 2 [Anaerolineae bacterium]